MPAKGGARHGGEDARLGNRAGARAPPRARARSTPALLWGNLGVSLLVLVAGTYLVPALSLPEALLAIVVGSLIGNAMLGVAGMIGADARVPAMVLMRAPLGRRGSWVPDRAERGAVRRLGDLRAADHRDRGRSALRRAVRLPRAVALDARLRRRRARRSPCSGPSTSSARSSASSRVWAVLASLALPDVVGARRRRLRRALGPAAARADSSVLEGVDLVVAITVSWIPLAADYTRFTRTPAQRVLGRRGRLLRRRLLAAGCSARCSSSRATSPTRRRCRPRSPRAASAAFLALLAVTVDETDEAFANVYSSAVSIQNLAPRAAAAAARRRRRRRRDGRRAHDRPALLRDASCSCSARSSCRSSACCWPTGSSPARATARATSSRRPAVPSGDDRRLDRRLRRSTSGCTRSARPWWVDARRRLDRPTSGIGATLPSFAVSLALGLVVAALGQAAASRGSTVGRRWAASR